MVPLKHQPCYFHTTTLAWTDRDSGTSRGRAVARGRTEEGPWGLRLLSRLRGRSWRARQVSDGPLREAGCSITSQMVVYAALPLRARANSQRQWGAPPPIQLRHPRSQRKGGNWKCRCSCCCGCSTCHPWAWSGCGEDRSSQRCTAAEQVLFSSTWRTQGHSLDALHEAPAMHFCLNSDTGRYLVLKKIGVFLLFRYFFSLKCC